MQQSGRSFVPNRGQARRDSAGLSGAFCWLPLPPAIQLGLERDRARRKNETALGDLRARFETLSPREREIMVQVVRGRLSKQIVADFGISESTVKVHRSSSSRKMKAQSLSELTRMADRLKLVQEAQY